MQPPTATGALLWKAKGEFDKALVDQTEAIRLNPKLAIAFSNRGSLWTELGEYDKAIEDCNEAIRLNPKLATAYSNRGLAWIKKGEFDKAIDDCTTAIRLKPDFATAFINRGRRLRADGNMTGPSLTSIGRSKSTRSRHAFGNRGMVWLKKGEIDRAIADFTEALRIDPQLYEACNNRGLAWLQKGELENAFADLNEAIRLKPDKRHAFYNRALCGGVCGEFEKSRADCDEALKSSCKSPSEFARCAQSPRHHLDLRGKYRTGHGRLRRSRPAR